MHSDCSRIILNAAESVLSDEGLFQKGRSRIWIDDNGWYLTIVEFQPSGFAKGCYLNVAIHYLWQETDYLSFDYGGRVSGFVEFSGDEEQFMSDMTDLVRVAIRQVRKYRRFTDFKYAKKQVLKAKTASETRELYHKLMMCGLCKDVSARKFFRQLQAKHSNIKFPFEQEIYDEIEKQIAPVIDDTQAMYLYVASKIMGQRDSWRRKPGMERLCEQIVL